MSGSLASLCIAYVTITKEAAMLSASASGTVGRVINDTHCTANMLESKGERHQMHKQVGQWTLGGFDGSIAVLTQTRLTFGFRPKVLLYFCWHIRFQPNVIGHFWFRPKVEFPLSVDV